MELFTESGTCLNDNLNEYKGIFYNENEEEEQKFYEGGAHFKYKDLYNILEELIKKEEKMNNPITTDYNYSPDNTILNFNFISKGKSRNIRENIKKEERKEIGTEINKNKDNCTIRENNKNKLKKIFGISSFTVFDKKLRFLLRKNLSKNKKRNKKKNSPIKQVKKTRPVSSTIQNKEMNKRKEILILGNNFKNTSNGRNIVKKKSKNNSLKKLSFSSQNLRKLFSSSNRFNSILSRNIKNKSNNKEMEKRNIKNTIPYKISKINTVISNKSRNMNIINEYNNFFFINNNNNKISRTFHNNKNEISYNQIKEKPHSLGKINSDLNKKNKNKNNNLVSKTNQKLLNHKIRHMHLINNLFKNNKELINNTNSLEISIKSNISSTHNIQISSRNKKMKTINKTSNNNFVINLNMINHSHKNNSVQKNKALINNKNNKITETISNSISKFKTKPNSVNSTGSKTNSIIGKGNNNKMGWK